MRPFLLQADSHMADSHMADGLNQRNYHLPITLEGSSLKANGHAFLTDIPTNIQISTAFSSIDDSEPHRGCFIGFDSPQPHSRHVTPIGKLRGIRFMSIFRFKVWWTTHWIGSSGSDIENETQILLLDKSSDSNRPFVLLLPIIEGSFRSCLEPGDSDYINICVESGSTRVFSSSFKKILYIHSGSDPYEVINDAIKEVNATLPTFNRLSGKSPPGIVNKFGWCTWDAFYLSVHPQGVRDGVEELVKNGCPPGFVLIDDGWQSISHDRDEITKEGMNQAVAGEQMPCRLLRFEENYKFRDYVSPGQAPGADVKGLKAFVKDLKQEFPSLEFVYVWHALCGYWGGVRPSVPGLPESVIVKPELSPGLQRLMEDLAVDKIVDNQVGLVHPAMAEKLFDGIHHHLHASGIDGVKVDVIHILEMLCENYGGRVQLAKEYYEALTKSVKKHFNGNGVIASMEHCNDFFFLGTETISLGRVGDDFWCTDQSGDPNASFWLQGCHMVHCAFNSLWMGNFMQPDWDMFQSTHPSAEFHAASRAISGGPIYVSDSVGQHNFDLLRRLVLPDGSILRCDYYALPTQDCLFENPLHDGKTMLKIWNLNRCTGVIGAFNCQGGGWCRQTRSNRCFSQYSKKVTAMFNPMDIRWNSGKNPMSIADASFFALYFSKAHKLLLSKPSEKTEISLDPFNFELITVSPVTCISPNSDIKFAPIGLINMLNAGGAIRSVTVGLENSVQFLVKGSGDFRIFASHKPSTCRINGEDVEFQFENSMVILDVPWLSNSVLARVECSF